MRLKSAVLSERLIRPSGRKHHKNHILLGADSGRTEIISTFASFYSEGIRAVPYGGM
ncbi:hypothetical protein Barb6XT_02625 [Bacteroidales bacterium Barb6XT]|nr:hypothetical protein Barb6XT_02625 [Bacteroidales bacterium Barb6XT]